MNLLAHLRCTVLSCDRSKHWRHVADLRTDELEEVLAENVRLHGVIREMEKHSRQFLLADGSVVRPGFADWEES